MFKKILIHTKKSIKLIMLLVIAVFLIIGTVSYFFKPTYRVTIGGKQVGYTANKSQLQTKISEYMKNGDGNDVAFVQVEELPEYQLCLLKRDIVTNDDEIFEKIKTEGTAYYRYYAICENQEEKAYVSSFSEAENVVNSLKEKNSANMETLAISEKYETENKELVTAEAAISTLYKEPVKEPVAVASTNKVTTKGTVNTNTTISKANTNIGISLIKPVSGIITSRFSESSRIRSSRHTGLDIATSAGTPVKAAAGGTVTFAGNKGSYGKMVVITHGNGVQTYYAHCSKLYVSAGQTVGQGATIAAVGTTGNSTGPHLHLEVRVNGVAYNPQNYVY